MEDNNHYSPKVSEMMKIVENALRDSLLNTDTEPPTSESVSKRITETLTKYTDFEFSHFGINLKEGLYKGEIIIEPKNLYSLLWLSHIHVPYCEVEKAEEYKTKLGTFAFKDGQGYFLPIEPPEYIKINLTISEEKTDGENNGKK